MIKDLQLRVSIREEKHPDILILKSAEILCVSESDINGVKVLRKSIDARKKIDNFQLQGDGLYQRASS